MKWSFKIEGDDAPPNVPAPMVATAQSRPAGAPDQPKSAVVWAVLILGILAVAAISAVQGGI